MSDWLTTATTEALEQEHRRLARQRTLLRSQNRVGEAMKVGDRLMEIQRELTRRGAARPTVDDDHPQEVNLPLADHSRRRDILHALTRASEKYARPFTRGEFASFSVMGTDDWSDYARTVVQILQADVLIDIESTLRSLGGEDLGSRVDAIDERLARIEALLAGLAPRDAPPE